jgi:hypothetical protein
MISEATMTGDQFIPARKVRQRYGDISGMTLWRWERDARIGFPTHLKICGRKFYSLSALEAWERQRAAVTAKRQIK